GQTFATVFTTEHVIRLWDVASGKRRLASPGHLAAVQQVVFAADGQTLLTWGYDEALQHWDAASGQHRQAFPGEHAHALIAPDGHTVAVVADGEKPALRLCDVRSGRVLQAIADTEERAPEMAFSADGRLLAIETSPNFHVGRVRVWDTARGKDALPPLE